jgi:type II secretory pathway pseudopilin PulG
MAIPARRLSDESGFTIVEVLVSMLLLLIVMGAVLATLDGFTSNADRQSRITDANDHVRRTMDRIVADLRQAATIEVADPNDLVYTVSQSGADTRRERICLSSDGKLWRQTLVTSTPAATAMGTGQACPTGAGTASRVAQLQSGNSADNPIFEYDGATPATVRSVGLTFALQSGATKRPVSSTLRASAFVRAQGETAPTTNANDIGATCNASGEPTVTLSSSVGGTSVTYTDLDGQTLGTASAGSALQLSSDGTVVANITGSSGIVSQIVKVLECP